MRAQIVVQRRGAEWWVEPTRGERRAFRAPAPAEEHARALALQLRPSEVRVVGPHGELLMRSLYGPGAPAGSVD